MLLELHDIAYNVAYRLRVGVQSSILDRLMEMSRSESNIDHAAVELGLHMAQVEALTQDLGIIHPELQGNRANELKRQTKSKLGIHAVAALEIMKDRRYRRRDYKTRCRIMLDICRQ
jgi:hypothetical protein